MKVLLILVRLSASASSASMFVSECDMTSITKRFNGGSAFSNLCFSTDEVLVRRDARQRKECRLTSFGAGDGFFAHNQSLDIWIPSGRTVYICNGHHIVFYLWSKELEKTPCGGHALGDRLEDFLVGFLLQQGVVWENDKQVRYGRSVKTHLSRRR